MPCSPAVLADSCASSAVLLVYMSERLNHVLGKQWKSFAEQPYFDKNGIFISAVLSAPLVLDMLVILVGLPAFFASSTLPCWFCWGISFQCGDAVADPICMQICYLLSLSRMLVQMKRQELRHKARQRANVAQPKGTKKTS